MVGWGFVFFAVELKWLQHIENDGFSQIIYRGRICVWICNLTVPSLIQFALPKRWLYLKPKKLSP